MKKVRKYVQMLASTEKETLDKIAEYESKGLLNEHLDTNPAPYKKVDENFEYLPKNIFKRAKLALQRFFFVGPLRRETNKLFQTIVNGRENLKGLRGAVICSNHVNKLDCMAIEHALKRKIYFTAAEFNNMEGFVGDMMRAGRMLPMSSTFSGQKNFLNTLSKLLKKGCLVNFFPERAEWWCYKKPRPQHNGAYNVAVKNNVPVVPVFITFNETEDSKKSPLGFKQFVVNILKPIYPDENLSLKENVEKMMQNCETQWKETYKSFYKKKEV